MTGAPLGARPQAGHIPGMVAFTKMHGLGNDFVVLDERATSLGLTPDQVRRIGDRHRGIGCDQIISLEATEGADVFMRIRNPDGSEAGACGNATRCVAALVAAESGRRQVTVRTIAGDLPCTILGDERVIADMGAPRLGWQDVPLSEAMDTLALPIAEAAAACSMGNPHATVFVEDIAAIDIATLGPRLEHHPIFPDRANIGFAQILASDHIRLAMWERGAGQTLACGSGACAAIVNAHRRGLTGRRATVTMPGGDLILEWRESDGHVLMEGPVATAFSGQFTL